MWICFLLGLFNVGNKLLVSLDLFLKVRARIKLGHHPTEVTRTILDQSHPGKHYLTYQTSSNTLCILNGLCLLSLTGPSTFSSVHNLSPEELSQVLELLLSGYWAFECLTVRDYNDMICGICGVAPKLEFAQRYSNNVLELKNVEVKHQNWSAGFIHKARHSASSSGFRCLCCDPSLSLLAVYLARVFGLRRSAHGWLLVDHGNRGHRTSHFPHWHSYHPCGCIYHRPLLSSSDERAHCHQHGEGQGPVTITAAPGY